MYRAFDTGASAQPIGLEFSRCPERTCDLRTTFAIRNLGDGLALILRGQQDVGITLRPLPAASICYAAVEAGALRRVARVLSLMQFDLSRDASFNPEGGGDVGFGRAQSVRLTRRPNVPLPDHAYLGVLPTRRRQSNLAPFVLRAVLDQGAHLDVTARVEEFLRALTQARFLTPVACNPGEPWVVRLPRGMRELLCDA